jgi:hypothetical protein
MKTATIKTAESVVANLVARLEALQKADRSVMTGSEKGQHTRRLKEATANLETQQAVLAGLVEEQDAATEEGQAIVDALEEMMASEEAKEVTAEIVAAISIAIEADKLGVSYTSMLMSAAKSCLYYFDEETGVWLQTDVDDAFTFWTNCMDSAYDEMRGDKAAKDIIPGSVRNARSVINWGIKNLEICDQYKGSEEPECITFNELKKRKAAMKNAAAATSDGEGEEGEKESGVSHADLDQALADIAKLNQIAGELKKALQKGDTLADEKCYQLQEATCLALSRYNDGLQIIASDDAAGILDDDIITAEEAKALVS